MKKIFVLLLNFLLVQLAMAQDTKSEKRTRREERKQKINALIHQEEEGIISHHKHMVFGFKLTNDGYGGFVEIGRMQSVNKSLLFQLDISERKNAKEEKLENQNNPSAPLVFGKMNFFYPVKLGVQQQILLGNKGNKNGVCVTGNFGGGVSLGLLRPYLNEIFDQNSGKYGFATFNANGELQLETDFPPTQQVFIVGGPDVSSGWSKLKVVPGIYAKPSVRFDYGRYNEMVSAIEIGGFAEYYFKKIPQMILIKQNNFFLGAYVSILFGRRK